MYLSNIGGVFMIEQQQKLMLSPYMEIYELVIPKDNLLRQIKELVDFSFIYDELLANYCLDNGRNAVPPIRMFKYLLLKSIYDLSDVDVVERSKYDMSFKYFLDMTPEDEVINPSSLTKFRKLRLKDMNLLDMLITKTVQLALEKGIIKSKSIIVDATHTKSRYNQKTPRQVLQEQSKKLRRSIYEIDETMKEKFPDKNTEDSLEKELKYCKQLIDVVKGNEEICSYPKVQEKLNLLEESVTDDMEHLETSKDEDAKTGHKTADTSFFGYKTHIAMTEERIITAATITSGEKTDGKELPKLVQKSKAAGIQIESVIGDMAYSEKKNIEAAKEGDYELIAKLNPIITQGNRRKEDEFEFNKDAGMYQCKAGHLAIHKYLEIKNGKLPKTPVTLIFGAKAAPAYTIAKDIIHLILCLQEIINNDPEVSPYLKVVMVENYNVTKAEKLIPACDISEQISLASKEASGTGNMKFMLNGAVTLGTEDGANVEIHELVGDDNIFVFGASSDEVIEHYKKADYSAKDYYKKNPKIKAAVDFITGKQMMKIGCKESLERLQKELIGKDWFMTFLDFDAYKKAKDKALAAYTDQKEWAKKMLVNIAEAGYFSSDRTIEQYNRDIWKLTRS